MKLERHEVSFMTYTLSMPPKVNDVLGKSCNFTVMCNKFPSSPSLNYRISSSALRIRRQADSCWKLCHHGHSKAASGIYRAARNLYTVSSETRTRLGKQIHTIRRSTADTASVKISGKQVKVFLRTHYAAGWQGRIMCVRVCLWSVEAH